jgi:hypothetical protein
MSPFYGIFIYSTSSACVYVHSYSVFWVYFNKFYVLKTHRIQFLFLKKNNKLDTVLFSSQDVIPYRTYMSVSCAVEHRVNEALVASIL